MDDSWAELMIIVVRTLLLPAFKSAECLLDGNELSFYMGNENRILTTTRCCYANLCCNDDSGAELTILMLRTLTMPAIGTA
jgi:hypothetical protein